MFLYTMPELIEEQGDRLASLGIDIVDRASTG
jgi:hypothetical protein